MKTPQLWQKLTAGFKKPFQKLFQKKDRAPKSTQTDFFRESGESVYHKSKGHRKLRKRKNKQANKSRAINAKINKNWKR